jgi:hypothetical protein
VLGVEQPPTIPPTTIIQTAILGAIEGLCESEFIGGVPRSDWAAWGRIMMYLAKKR